MTIYINPEYIQNLKGLEVVSENSPYNELVYPKYGLSREFPPP